MATTTQVKLILEAQNKISAELRKINSDLGKFKKKAVNTNKKIQSSNKSFMGTLGGIRAAYIGVAAVVGGVFARAMIKNASEMEQSRIAFETMLGDADQASILLKKISDFARKTPFDLPGVVSGAQKLLAYNISAEKILPTLKSLGDIAAGVGREKLPQLILAFGQVKSATFLTGMELRQFTEAGVPLLAELAKQSGKTAAQIKKDMESGVRIPFKDVEKALLSLTGKGGRFYNLMDKQSQTLAGQTENLKDNFVRLGNSILGVSETGDVIKGSLFDNLRISIFGLNKNIDQNTNKVVLWGSAMVNSFTATGRTLFNAVSIVARMIVEPYRIAFSVGKETILNLKNILKGDLTISFDETAGAIKRFSEGVTSDAVDMAEGWVLANDAVGASLAGVNQGTGELKAGVSDMASGIEEDISKAEKSFASKTLSMIKKLKDLRDEFKESRKELKKSYEEDKDEMKKQLSGNIAGVLISKEEELAKIREELARATTAQEKMELIMRENDIKMFLSAHQADYQKFASGIKKLRDFNNLDEIQQLKVKYQIEKDTRAEQFEDEMKDLKKQQKKRLKQIKREIKDIKKEFKSFLKTKTYRKIEKLFGGIKSIVKGRQFGGGVTAGQPTVVGEHRPEVFVPSQSGNIKQVDQVGKGEVNINFNNVSITNEADENRLVQKISELFSQQNSLGRFGIK